MRDFEQVRKELAKAARAAFSELRTDVPDEHFYVFALYDCEDATGPSPSANSEEKFQYLAKRFKRTSPRDLAVTRWGTAEWGYEAVGCEHFHPAWALLRELAAATPGAAYSAYKAQTFAATVGALRDLDDEGFFGTGQERLAVTAFVSISDGEDAAWLERESARLVNPPQVFAAFEEGWRWLYPDHDEGSGLVYERFMAIVADWPARR